MAALSQSSPTPTEIAKRSERADRILDAAATLILRWGYNKTTIDDIAKQAGVAKGTIYLHWKTREDLFAALIHREKLQMGNEIRAAIVADPEGATLHGMLKHSATALIKRPVMKALLLRDIDVLGKLAQTEHADAAYLERLAGFKVYFDLLGEQGLIRTDLPLRVQLYTFSAIFVGFLVVAPFMPAEYLLADDEIAAMMAETVHRTLELGRPAPPAAADKASTLFVQYMDEAAAAAQAQFAAELDSTPTAA